MDKKEMLKVLNGAISFIDEICNEVDCDTIENFNEKWDNFVKPLLDAKDNLSKQM